MTIPSYDSVDVFVQAYLDLITSEHIERPKFVASVISVLQPVVDVTKMMELLPTNFDLDTAVGVQLDAVGFWVGVSRFLETPLEGVYFSFDTANVGFDQGVWKGQFDPVSGLTTLPDDAYRLLLRARIAANHWDGTIGGAYAAYQILFENTGFLVLLQDANLPFVNTFFSFDDSVHGFDVSEWLSADNAVQQMNIYVLFFGPPPNAVTRAMLLGGYLELKPAGVQILGYVTQSVPDVPFFAFDVNSSTMAGFDIGAWGTINAP